MCPSHVLQGLQSINHPVFPWVAKNSHFWLLPGIDSFEGFFLSALRNSVSFVLPKRASIYAQIEISGSALPNKTRNEFHCGLDFYSASCFLYLRFFTHDLACMALYHIPTNLMDLCMIHLRGCRSIVNCPAHPLSYPTHKHRHLNDTH